jgi:3-oxoadipate enol-lactonase
MNEQLTPDGKTAYIEAGHGRPLVLLHGFPLSKAMWLPQRGGLATLTRVLAPDLPGFGGSRGFEGTPSIDAMADRVVEFIDALRIREPVILCGLSMGGYVALGVSRRHSDRLRGLILADTKADPDDEAGKANRDRTIALAKASGSSAVIDQMMPKLVGSETAERRPEVASELRSIAAAQSSAAVIAALQAMRDRPDANPGLANIAVPTLVLVGEQDTLIPPAKGAELARAISGSELVTIPGAGHIANMERPEAFNAAIRAFLERVR